MTRTTERYVYNGPVPPDNTDTNFKPNRYILAYAQKTVKPGGRILDYGAGRYARNAKGLRELGFEVYAYDPYEHKCSGDGWAGVSEDLPVGERFDLVFSAYVLNVVTEAVEQTLDFSDFGPDVHWARGSDILKMARGALNVKRKGRVFEFFMDTFAKVHPTAGEEMEHGEVTEDTLMQFCEHGMITIRGFQRIPSPPGYVRIPQGSSSLFLK